MPLTSRTLFIAALSVFIVTGAFTLDYRVVSSILVDPQSPAGDSTLLGTILGAWNGAALGVIVNFFYGRSSDSDRKTDIIAQSTPPAATSTTVTPGKTVTESAPLPPSPPSEPAEPVTPPSPRPLP